MVVTPSAMIQLGTQIPPFSLSDANGNSWSPNTGTATLVIFMCNHCPYVIHGAELLKTIHGVCKENGVAMCGINSNDISTHPDDSPEKMLEAAVNYSWTFPYLFDETQAVAKQFGATCTPDVFLFGADGKLYYRGQFDNTRPNDGIKGDGADLISAIQQMVNGDPSPENQTPAVGCNIKWKQ